MNITELEKQITELQDIEAIKKLKAEYCDICDDAHNPDRIVTIFANDGIWEAEGVGYAKGPAELRTLFKSFARANALKRLSYQDLQQRVGIEGTRQPFAGQTFGIGFLA